uniref:Transcriptional regulator, PadR family n=1 Tax=uncultured bacterium A1Q1_fos_324 TaxID=1256572 RepID=L7VQA3_9BACT|nr:transcriptional regulator, PadR family [uncultured bacterium A1Q1_fos_324]
MALEHAILVSLSEKSATGYGLARRFDASIGHFWRATHQQIYKVLARMEEAGLVSTKLAKRDGRLDKKTYSITPAGEQELVRWSREPSNREVARSDFTVKLRGLADPVAMRIDAQRRRDEVAEELSAFEESRAKHHPDPAELSGKKLGSYLALLGGIHYAQADLAWCDEILARLSSEEH